MFIPKHSFYSVEKKLKKGKWEKVEMTENDWDLFWVYQNWNFLPGKSISRREKNQETWLCPLCTPLN